MNPKYVVINADDLGISEGVNFAVAQAHREGVLTSASLMANGTAFEHAVETVIRPNPRLGVGIHLCLTSGRSVLPARLVPDLVDARGCFRYGFLSLFRALRKEPGRLLPQIEAELEAQISYVRDAGVSIDQIDGHRYVHTIPAVFGIAQKLAQRFDCRWMRRPDEPLGLLAAWMPGSGMMRRVQNLPKRWVLTRLSRENWRQPVFTQSAERFFGVLDSGGVSSGVLATLLRSARPGVTEIVTHPGTKVGRLENVWTADDRRFLDSNHREAETIALIDPRVRDVCRQSEIVLTSFSEVPTAVASDQRRHRERIPQTTTAAHSHECCCAKE